MPYYPPSSGGSGNAPTNPKPYIHLPNGWNTGWLAAKAAQAGTVAIYGASQAQGTQQNTNIVTKRMSRLLLNYLNATIGGAKVAEYFGYVDNVNKVGTWSAGGSAPWAVGGVASGDANDGFVSMLQTNGAGVAMTHTTPFACTEADILIRDLAAGTGHYTVDGGSNVNIVTTGDGTVKRIQITGMTNATHVIAVSTAAANQFGLLGITLYYGARAATGWTMALHAMNGQSIQNLYDVAGTKAAWSSSQATIGPIAAPDLLILQLGGNENNQGSDVSQGMTTIIEATLKAKPTTSVLCCAEPCFTPTLSDVSVAFGSGYGPSYEQTVERIFGVAASNGFGFIDQYARWAPNPVAQGFIASGSGTGQPHPNDAGHADFAAAIESVL